MPESIFMPYRFAEGALELKTVGLEIDGQPFELARVLHQDVKVIDLSALDSWSEAELAVEVTDPNDQLTNVVASGEDVLDCLKLHSLIRCRKSRFRSAISLTADAGRKWTGSVSFARADCLGNVQLQSVALRNCLQTESDAVANREGQRTADSELWTISIDESSTLPGGAINNEWRNFSEADDEELRSRADCGWFLDLRQVDKPKLWLNEGIEGLKNALVVEQKIGQSARLRDALTHSILQPVITQLVLSILKNGDGCAFEELEHYQQSVLLHFANHIEIGSAEIVATRWLKEFKQDFPSVLEELGTAAQREVGFSHGAEQLIKTFGVETDE